MSKEYNKKITENLITPETVLSTEKDTKDVNNKITQELKNPGKMYIRMSCKELDEFFSSKQVEQMKSKCKNLYYTYDLKRGILEVNSLRKTDDNIHITDLLMFALAKIEDMEIKLKSYTEGGFYSGN